MNGELRPPARPSIFPRVRGGATQRVGLARIGYVCVDTDEADGEWPVKPEINSRRTVVGCLERLERPPPPATCLGDILVGKAVVGEAVVGHDPAGGDRVRGG